MEIKPNNIYLGDCYEAIKDLPDKSKYYQKLCKERNDYYKLKYENGTN